MTSNIQSTARPIPSPRDEGAGRDSTNGQGSRFVPLNRSETPGSAGVSPARGGTASRRDAGAPRIGSWVGSGRGAAQTSVARLLRRNQTKEEKELWRALKAGRFAGFKFRRQHHIGTYYLDFFCPTAKLSVELDGFQHGLPEQMQRDCEREKFLDALGIEELRFWNHQWNRHREGVLLDIWAALHRRTGCVAVMRKVENHRFVPPNPDKIIPSPTKPKLR